MSDATVQQVQPICVNAPVVSGIGDTEILQRLTLDLGGLLTAVAGLLPFVGGFVADAVLLSKRVEITECDVFTNKVLVNGVLHKDVLLKIAPITPLPLPGVLTSPSDCSVTVAVPVDLVIDCPFGACITVPGACPGDTCQIERACVDAEKDLLINTNGDAFPEVLEEKVCIHLTVKTIRNQQVTILPAEPNICPQPPVPSANCPTVCPDTGLRSASRLNLLAPTP